VSFGELDFLWDKLNLTVFDLAGLIVLVTVGVWLIVRVREWLHSRDDPAAADHTMLIQMNDLHRAGNLSDQEFRSINGRLIERIHQAEAVRGQNAPET